MSSAFLTPSGEEEEKEQARRSRRRLTRIMLVVVVLVLAVLGAEVAYFVSVERAPAVTSAQRDWTGWQRVRDNDSYASYRVPPQFTVEDALRRRSLGLQSQDGPDLVVLRSTAVAFDRQCTEPGAVTALAGFVEHPPDADVPPAQDVLAAAVTQSLTGRGGGGPEVPAGTLEEITLADGSAATRAGVLVPATGAYPCSPPQLRFVLVEFAPGGRRTQFLLVTDVGDDRELAEGVEQQIVSSLDETR